MVFKGVDNQQVVFNLKYYDDSEITGYIAESEIIRLHLYLEIGETLSHTSILISDVEKIIKWFERLSLNNLIEPKLLIMDNQFYFDLIENNLSSKIVRITYDTTVPVPGIGGYSLAPGYKYEDLFKKLYMECEIDNLELQRIIKELKTELQIELQIGLQVESNKPKPK